MAKDKRGNLAVNFLVLFGFLFLILLLVPYRVGSRSGPWLFKTCYANMRVMLGALEMYNMDYSGVLKSDFDLDEKFQKDILIPSGYLKGVVVCPMGMVPYPTSFTSKLDSFLWSFSFLDPFRRLLLRAMGYKSASSPGFYSMKDFPLKSEIRCSLHGTISP